MRCAAPLDTAGFHCRETDQSSEWEIVCGDASNCRQFPSSPLLSPQSALQPTAAVLACRTQEMNAYDAGRPRFSDHCAGMHVC